jgi:hypothetical protein
MVKIMHHTPFPEPSLPKGCRWSGQSESDFKPFAMGVAISGGAWAEMLGGNGLGVQK